MRETAPKGEPAAAAVRVATPPVRAPTGGIRRGGRAVDAEGERRKRAEEAVARQVTLPLVLALNPNPKPYPYPYPYPYSYP